MAMATMEGATVAGQDDPSPADDDPEAEAMRAFYADPGDPDLPPCAMKAGLLRGYWDHTARLRGRKPGR